MSSVERNTVTTGDIDYVAFFLKEKDKPTGSLTYYDLTGMSSIVFRMRAIGASTNAISATMSTVAGDATLSNTLGYCRVKVTFPTAGEYVSEVEVFITGGNKTWKGPYYVIETALG